eukprot:9486133-Pyramimonas_sp.AAC.2
MLDAHPHACVGELKAGLHLLLLLLLRGEMRSRALLVHNRGLSGRRQGAENTYLLALHGSEGPVCARRHVVVELGHAHDRVQTDVPQPDQPRLVRELLPLQEQSVLGRAVRPHHRPPCEGEPQRQLQVDDHRVVVAGHCERRQKVTESVVLPPGNSWRVAMLQGAHLRGVEHVIHQPVGVLANLLALLGERAAHLVGRPTCRLLPRRAVRV